MYGNTIRFQLRSVKDDRLFTLWLVHVKPRKRLNLLKLSGHSPALKGLSSPSQGNDSPDKHTHTYCIPLSKSKCLLSNYAIHNANSLFCRNGKETDKAQHYSLSFCKRCLNLVESLKITLGFTQLLFTRQETKFAMSMPMDK